MIHKPVNVCLQTMGSNEYKRLSTYFFNSGGCALLILSPWDLPGRQTSWALVQTWRRKRGESEHTPRKTGPVKLLREAAFNGAPLQTESGLR